MIALLLLHHLLWLPGLSLKYEHGRLACKEIHLGGHRGWRLRVVEAFIIILTFSQLLYLMLLHAGMFSSRYGPGYRDNYGTSAATAEPVHKEGGGVVTGSRV